MKFVLLLAFLFMWLANPITGGKLFPGFNNPEKWMKRVIRKLQRKTSAYGNMITSNTAEISNTAGFISSINKCESKYINDPDNGLICCFEDNLNKGQCLCNGMTIDDSSNPGSCCMANQEHPDHCLCSGTDMDDPTNPGNCCFANSGQRLCTGNYTDVPSKRCFNLDWKGDGICDDQNNHGGCNFDGGDCCGDNVDTDLCTQCQCLEEEAPLPNAVGCCYADPNITGQCLCTGADIDDPDNTGSCCVDDPDSPGTCCIDSITCNGQGTCSSGDSGICACNSGFTGDRCNVTTCPGVPVCSDSGSCPQGGTVCNCQAGFHGDDCATFCVATTTCNGNGTCGLDGICQCNQGFTGSDCTEKLGNVVMVTTGWPFSSSTKTEILDLVSGESCADLADFPLVWGYGVGANLNGTPVVCGGVDSSWAGHQTCYKFTSSGFQAFASMKEIRHALAGVVYKNKFHVFGGYGIYLGYDNSDKLQTSEIISIDGSVEEGPDLPVAVVDHAISSFNSSVSILSGGNTKATKSSPLTWYFNHETQAFSSGPSLLTGRMAHASASCVDKVTQEKIFIVAGGHDGHTVYISSTEMLINGIWQLGPEMPIALLSYSIVEMQGDVYLFGGRSSSSRSNSAIYKLSCSSGICSWSTINQALKVGRERFAVFLVPKTFCL